MTKDIVRKCIACSKIKNRKDLIKITIDNESKEVFLNPNSKIFGRSAYLCYNESCIKETLKKNKLEKALKTKITEDFKEQLVSFSQRTNL